MHDGFPASRAVGTDIYPAFFDLGHKIWNDADSCSIKFISGDVFALPSSPPPPTSSLSKLEDLQGKAKYIYTGAVFHLFDEAAQEKMARKVAALANWKGKGTFLFGMHVGAENVGLRFDPWMEYVLVPSLLSF